MKTTFLIGSVAAAVGLVSAGYMLVADDEATAATVEDDSKGDRRNRAREATASPREDRSDWDTEERIEALETEVAQLRRQVRAMQLRSGAPGAFADADADGLEPGDPALQDSVREIVADERERQREAEMERRRERMRERTDELLGELVAKAGINDEQREKIGSLWTEERDQMFSLMMEARSGERDFRDVREEARQLRRNSDEQAKAMLDEEQYATYQDLRPRGPGGRGGRGGGGGRPGGGQGDD